MAKPKDSEQNQAKGTLFVGSIIIGTAIGLLLNRVEVGSMLGVGIGFILMSLVRTK